MRPYLEINSRCIACDNCRLVCPENSIIKAGQDYIVDSWSCTLCNICVEVCPAQCIDLLAEEDVG